MHLQVEEFIGRCRDMFPSLFKGTDVLEIGSYDINGSVRKFFTNPTKYVGVDLIEGPGVDMVDNGHTVQFSHQFDVAISAECFEHNPHWHATFINMIEHTRPGGLVIMTCASTGRAEHGTSRANPDDSPGTVLRGWSYYRNLTEADFDTSLRSRFWPYAFEYSAINKDLYFYGVVR